MGDVPAALEFFNHRARGRSNSEPPELSSRDTKRREKRATVLAKGTPPSDGRARRFEKPVIEPEKDWCSWKGDEGVWWAMDGTDRCWGNEKKES